MNLGAFSWEAAALSSWLSVHVAGVVGQAWLERNVAKELMAFPESFPKTYTCPKCGSQTYEMGQIRVSGGFWSSFFDVGNKRYNSCLLYTSDAADEP